MSSNTVAEAIQVAIGHHQAGRLAEAEAIYRQVLAQFPDHADALAFAGGPGLPDGSTWTWRST